jgi:hypothetical protein
MTGFFHKQERERREKPAENELHYQVNALISLLGNLYGSEQMALQAKKLEVLDLLRSHEPEKRLMALQKMVFGDPPMEGDDPNQTQKLIKQLESGIIDLLARKKVEGEIEKKITQRMQERYDEYVKENYPKFAGSYDLVRWALVGVLAVLYLVTLLAALGYPVNVGAIVQITIALLFILMGNIMGKFRFNYFVGIRTPWTLASEEVWRKTHRLGGRLWVLAGLIGLFSVLLPPPGNFIGLVGSIFLATIGTTLYSFFLYRRSQREK